MNYGKFARDHSIVNETEGIVLYTIDEKLKSKGILKGIESIAHEDDPLFGSSSPMTGIEFRFLVGRLCKKCEIPQPEKSDLYRINSTRALLDYFNQNVPSQTARNMNEQYKDALRQAEQY